jgi:hypothetical protein
VLSSWPPAETLRTKESGVKYSSFLKLSVAVNLSLAAALAWSAAAAGGPGAVVARVLSSLMPGEASLPFALATAGGLVMLMLVLGALVEISALLRAASPPMKGSQARPLAHR